MTKNYKEMRFETTEALKNGVDKWVDAIRESEEYREKFSENAHRRCVEMAERFARRVKGSELPDLDEGWGYRIFGLAHYTDAFAMLSMCSEEKPEAYLLMEIKQRPITVEAYAKLHGVSEETVNGWIKECRFPLAKCGNGKWRIPELALPAEEAFPDCIADWHWLGTPTSLPEEYAYLNKYEGIGLESDEDGTSWMKVFSYETLKAEAVQITEEDRERLQYALYEDPFAEIRLGHVLIRNDGPFYFGG